MSNVKASSAPKKMELNFSTEVEFEAVDGEFVSFDEVLRCGRAKGEQSEERGKVRARGEGRGRE